MIRYKIPGRLDIEIENIVFDYNGTIALDGKIMDGMREAFSELSRSAKIYLLTADTYGTVEKECLGLNAEVLTFPRENAGESKREIVKKLGGDKTICIGNGFNDIPMFSESIVSIAVIEGEGASGKLLLSADIITRSILEAVEIILNKEKMKAVLRN